MPAPGPQALPEYQGSGFQIPGAVQPSQNPYMQSAFQSQMQGAKDYANNLKSNSDALYNTYASAAESQLPGLIQQNRESYNSRGLLNSGMEKAGEAGTVQNMNTQLAQTRAQINQGLNQNLNQLEGNAFNTAGLLAQPGPQTAQPQLSGIQSQILAQAAQNQMNSQVIGSIFGGVGSVGGIGLANMMQNNGNNPTMGAGTPLSAEIAAFNPSLSYGSSPYSPVTPSYPSLYGGNP